MLRFCHGAYDWANDGGDASREGFMFGLSDVDGILLEYFLPCIGKVEGDTECVDGVFDVL